MTLSLLLLILSGVVGFLFAHILTRAAFIRKHRKGLTEAAPKGFFCYFPLLSKLFWGIFLVSIPLIWVTAYMVLRAEPTAECKDGTISYSDHGMGTCSDHGGVKRWLNEVPDQK